MWSVEIDRGHQVLQLQFSGHVAPKEAEACCVQVLKLLPELEPGFVLVSDLSTLESMEVDCSPFIDRVMDALNQRGVKKVLRVIPDPHKDIGFGIMSLFHYGPEVHVVTVKSVEQARKRLA